MKKYFVCIFLFSWSGLIYPYVHTQARSGHALHWSSSSSIIDVFVNAQNGQGLAEATIQSIANTSITEWNNLSRITLRKNSTAGRGQVGLNEIYFTTDPSVFNGSGVVGITLLGFSEASGEISSADILLNDNYSFSTSSTAINYIGNVIAHELGHFLGLNHGQVTGTTMFYELFKGQSKLSDDDRAGLYSTYPTGDSAKGILTGTIVGGRGLAQVFGAHVQAISVKTGKIMGATISELDGKFTIDGLPRDDQYFIYTSPIKQGLGLLSDYANARSDFCESSATYRGSFFQSCGSSSEGFPQAVKLNSSTVNVGNVTIRCGLDSPPEYIQNKNTTPALFNVNAYTSSGLGGSFVGFFSSSEILQESSTAGTIKDYFKINFSGLSSSDWDTYSTANNLFLELKVINQPFYSTYKAFVSIKRASGAYTDITPKYEQEADGWGNIDTVTRIAINKALSSDNDFEIKITPEIMDFSHFPTGIPFSKNELFPSYASLQDDLYFYLVIATVVKDIGGGVYTQVASKNDSPSDNTTCPDAINTYALTNYTANGPTTTAERKSAGCGTVVDVKNGTGGDGGSSPGGFMVGILLSFILSYAASRYSKMA